MEVIGYVGTELRTAKYESDVVLIITTKQDLPTICLLSDDEVKSLISDLRSRQKSIFQQLRDRWNKAIRRNREEIL